MHAKMFQYLEQYCHVDINLKYFLNQENLPLDV